ncbi:MAG: hypothetical protein ACJ8GN_09740 [Longimicrobiaceae bacterium]
MNARLSFVLCAALLAAAPAAAQDRRLEERLPAAALPAVRAAVDAARAQRLPTEPLVQRALEGAAREAGPERIVAAVRELANRLQTARGVLGRRAAEAELTAGAGALYAGITVEELELLRDTRRRGSLAAPLVTLADLVERGVPREAAFAAVVALVQAGVPDESWTAFRQGVAEDIRAGAGPGEAAFTRTQGALLRGRPPARRPSRPVAPRPPPRPRPPSAPSFRQIPNPH